MKFERQIFRIVVAQKYISILYIFLHVCSTGGGRGHKDFWINALKWSIIYNEDKTAEQDIIILYQTVWVAHWKRRSDSVLCYGDLRLGCFVCLSMYCYVFLCVYVLVQSLDLTKANWTLRVVSDKSKAESIEVTRRADRIKAIKKAWELVEPGRCAKVTQELWLI